MPLLQNQSTASTVYLGSASLGFILFLIGAVLGENPFSVFAVFTAALILTALLVYAASSSASRYVLGGAAFFGLVIGVLTLLLALQNQLTQIQFFTFASLFPPQFRIPAVAAATLLIVGSVTALLSVAAHLILEKQRAGEKTVLDRLQTAARAQSVAGFANALFGDFVDRHRNDFIDVKHHLARADMNVLFRTYVAEMLTAAVVSYVLALIMVVLILFLVEMEVLFQIVMLLFFPILVSASTFAGLWLYPVKKANDRKYNIDSNLPFALNQLAAIASSGLPPSQGFALLTDYRDYGEIAVEADKIVKRVKVFGEDITTAIRSVAENTPSVQWKEVLYGMLSVIETGGDMSDYLTVQAEDALFEYKLERKERIKSLSTYAAFYTALLVTAPLFMITILAVLNVLRGTIFGVDIIQAMRFGAYVIMPLLNIAFLLFLSVARVDV